MSLCAYEPSKEWSGQEDLNFERPDVFSNLLILNDAKTSRTAEIPPSKYVLSTRLILHRAHHLDFESLPVVHRHPHHIVLS